MTIKIQQLFLLSLLIISFSSIGGEVTGAGITQMLGQYNIDFNKLKLQGYKMLINEKLKKAGKTPLQEIEYFVGDQSVYKVKNINRLEFKSGQANQLLWKNIEHIEVQNQFVLPQEVDALIVKPKKTESDLTDEH